MVHVCQFTLPAAVRGILERALGPEPGVVTQSRLEMQRPRD